MGLCEPLAPLPALPKEGPHTCSFRGASSSREASLGWADPTKQDSAVIKSTDSGARPPRAPCPALPSCENWSPPSPSAPQFSQR